MVLFWSALHQIASVWLDVALRPEVSQALERSMALTRAEAAAETFVESVRALRPDQLDRTGSRSPSNRTGLTTVSNVPASG